ncbi:alpha-mannosyltransferase och1 [Seiridium cupressi]
MPASGYQALHNEESASIGMEDMSSESQSPQLAAWDQMQIGNDRQLHTRKQWYVQNWTDLRSWTHIRKRPCVAWLGALVLICWCIFQFTTLFHPRQLHSISYKQIMQHKSLVSRKMWQILLPMPEDIHVNPVTFEEPSAWMEMNAGYTYTLFGIDGAAAFLESRFPNQTDYLETFNKLRNPGLKSDLFRYMVLYAEGGVYSDLDTRPKKPINEWVPEAYRPTARLVVGLEYDSLGGEVGESYTYPVQFAQWTIAAAPQHNVFTQMIDRCIQRLGELSEKHGAGNSDRGLLNSNDDDVLKATGPVAWTEIIFQDIQRQAPEIQSLQDLSRMEEPRLYGDILVLPINGFGSGQPHSGSARWFTPKEALVTHHAKSSWRIG